MSETITIVRHHGRISNVTDIPAALDAVGEPFLWAIGVLSWHDCYWEAASDALPGAFLEEYGHGLWSRPRAEHLGEAVVWGAAAQVRIARYGSTLRIALLYKGRDITDLPPPWSSGIVEEVHLRKHTSLVVQNPNAYPYALAQGSFDSNLFALLQEHGIGVEEYRKENEHCIDWRFCAPEGGIWHE